MKRLFKNPWAKGGELYPDWKENFSENNNIPLNNHVEDSARNSFDFEIYFQEFSTTISTPNNANTMLNELKGLLTDIRITIKTGMNTRPIDFNPESTLQDCQNLALLAVQRGENIANAVGFNANNITPNRNWYNIYITGTASPPPGVTVVITKSSVLSAMKAILLQHDVVKINISALDENYKKLKKIYEKYY